MSVMNAKKALVIVNPISGGGGGKRLVAGFSAKNPSIKVLCGNARVADPEHWTVLETTADGHWKKEALSYLQTGLFSLVVGVGGDGTLSHIASFLYENRAALQAMPQVAFFPGGRGNDFVRCLMGYSREAGDFWTWAARQKRWSLRALDVASASGKIFLNMASLGYGADVVENVHARRAIWSKSGIVYQVEGALAFFEKKKSSCEIVVDDKRVYTGPFFGAFVGNGKANGGGLFWTPDAKTDDGKLDAIAFERPSFFQMLHSLGLIKKKQYPSFKHSRASGGRMDFHFDFPTALELDGEFVGNAMSCGIICLPQAFQCWVLDAS